MVRANSCNQVVAENDHEGAPSQEALVGVEGLEPYLPSVSSPSHAGRSKISPGFTAGLLALDEFDTTTGLTTSASVSTMNAFLSHVFAIVVMPPIAELRASVPPNP